MKLIIIKEMEMSERVDTIDIGNVVYPNVPKVVASFTRGRVISRNVGTA